MDAAQAPPPYYGIFVNETILASWRERSMVEQWVHGTPEQAEAAAEATAWNYQPARPVSPVRRRVYRTGERSWTVIVDGQVSTWRFDVTYGELVGEAPVRQ